MGGQTVSWLGENLELSPAAFWLSLARAYAAGKSILFSMKITAIETTPIDVPRKREFAIRSGRGGAHVTSPFLLVKVHTDEGFTGVGEASCTPRWSGEDQVTGAHLIRTYLEPLLVGENPIEVEVLTQK